ncbi:Mpp10 protein [Trametopsis cervina]|nr:Mpp10 protein [Trametopsis cervina]
MSPGSDRSSTPELLEDSIVLPTELLALSTRIDEKPESFATGNKDIQLAALQAAKYVFDIALKSEAHSRAQIAQLLSALSPTAAPQTRSQAKRKANGAAPAKTRVAPQFEETPLPELCTNGMDEGQVWAQMELRGQKLCRVLEFALQGTLMVDEDEHMGKGLKKEKKAGADDMDVDGEEEEEDDTLGDDDFEDSSDDWDSEESLDIGEEAEEEESDHELDVPEGVQELRDPSDGEGDLDLDAPGAPKKKRGTKGKKGGNSELDDGFFDIAAFNAETEAAEARNTSRGRLGGDDEDEDEDAELEDVDMFAPVDGEEVNEGDEEEPFYKDFFAPPAKVYVPPNKQKKPTAPAVDAQKKKASVRFHEEVRVKSIKAKGKNLPVSMMQKPGSLSLDDDDDDEEDFEDEEDSKLSLSDEDEDEEERGSDDDEDDDDAMDEDEDEESGSEAGLEQREAIERLKDDLFADDEEEDTSGLSTYEKRQAALRAEIASLEATNVAPKAWTLLGEATARARPQNALLEEDLEFERIAKSVPLATEERVASLEARIRARVADSQFDDVVRRAPAGDDRPFLPSRVLELQDTKSKQSLAEIYEDEYTSAKVGGKADERDGQLAKEHTEIEGMWEGIAAKLDALSNAHFTPKAPKATISTVSNVAAASLESALPTTRATATLLAPREVFTPSTADLQSKSELTPAQKRALHNKEKKTKRKQSDALAKSVGKFAPGGSGKSRGSVKKQKEEALKSVVKNGKGVTVIGKKSKEAVTKKGKS